MKKPILVSILIFDFVLVLLLAPLRRYYQPVAIVAPHHDLVKDTRLQFFHTIAATRPNTKTIVIIGPNHFSPFQAGVSFSNIDWSLPSGQLRFASNLFSQLNFPLSLENNLIANDHAITALLPDIKTVWPNARILPILIGQQFSSTQLDPLIDSLSTSCRSDCLLIASVDFSHYLPATLANVHDYHTLSLLQNQDYNQLLGAEVDSPQSLYLQTKFSSQQSAKSFRLFAHTNSGILMHNPDIETTTHVFASYTRQPKKPSPSTPTRVVSSLEIDPEVNTNTVGPRFFYGPKVTLDPDSPYGFVIATIIDSNTTHQSFLPITHSSGRINFIRGPAKVKFIQEYFDSLGNSSNLIHKDYFWGTLTYDTTQ